MVGRMTACPHGSSNGCLHCFAALVKDRDRLALENARLRAALVLIAAFDDKTANSRLDATGSWGGFDEPGAVRVARKSLEAAP